MSVSPNDLHLRITRPSRSGVYLVTLTPYGSDTSEIEETVEDFDPHRFESEYLNALHTYVEREFSRERLKAMGQEIARLLLPESVCQKIRRRFWHTRDIPVRLFVTTACPELAAVPWEYAFIEADGEAVERSGFLCRHPAVHFHLIRQPSAPISVQPSTDKPLRVLLAWADPAAGKYARLPHLHDEVSCVEKVLQGHQIKVSVLENATCKLMKRRLGEVKPHILHFVGHGDALPSGGALILEGEEPLYADELAEWLKQTPCKLVTLSACHTASPHRGLAATLSAQGIPAVVGMQLPMRSATSSPFIHHFYSGLIQAKSVEKALSEARQMTPDPDWGVPSLYLASAESVLFPEVQAKASGAPSPPQGFFHVPYPQNPYFLGRDVELEKLHDHLKKDAGPPVVVGGLAGLGKTQLVVEYAHRHRTDYPGGVYWIDARDTSRMQEQFADLLHLFDVPEPSTEDSTEDRLRRMRAELHKIQERFLLVFDDITIATDLLQLQGLLPVTNQFPNPCRVVMTTRLHYVAESHFQEMDVPVLDALPAETLLRKGREPSDDSDEKNMRAIVARLGGLPLALALVAHHIRRLGVSFEEYLAFLKKKPQDTLKRARKSFIAATDHNGRLFDTLEISHCALSEDAQRALSILSCFAARGISRDLLYRVFAAEGNRDPDSDFDEALAELRDYYFVEHEADQRLTVHELTQTFAQGQMTEEVLRDTVERVAGVLTGCLNQANEAMEWRSVRREIAHCRMAEELCRKFHVNRNHGDLLQGLGLYCEAHGEYDAATGYLSANLALIEQRVCRQSAEAACVLRQIGDVYYNKGDSPAALRWQRDALAIAEACLPENDARLVANYSSIGVVLKSVQEFEEAAWYLYKAMALSKQVYGDRHVEYPISLNNIGTLLEAQGRLEEALTHLERAMTIDQAIFGPQHPNLAAYLKNIGRILTQQQKFPQALTSHEKALDIVEAAYGRQHPDVAACLYYCANTFASLGQIQKARDFYEEALTIYVRFFGADHYRCGIVREELQALPDNPPSSDTTAPEQ
jgi:tetratricopeptide (TPR) repeat protein